VAVKKKQKIFSYERVFQIASDADYSKARLISVINTGEANCLLVS